MADLTNIAAVKAWSGVTTANDDEMLTRLIGQASRMILNFLQKPTIFKTTFTTVFNGLGNQVIVLPYFPVLSISSLKIDAVTVPLASAPAQGGYFLAPWNGYTPGQAQEVAMNGFFFCRGYQNVVVSYYAGYAIANEAQTAALSVEVDQPQGTWGQDDGVTLNGVAMTKITSGTPTTGQYKLGPNGPGNYIFAAADVGQPVLISYSFIPADIEQACIELVGERYKAKTRIGEMSKTLGGQETVSFSQKPMNDYIMMMLQPYKRVTL